MDFSFTSYVLCDIVYDRIIYMICPVLCQRWQNENDQSSI